MQKSFRDGRAAPNVRKSRKIFRIFRIASVHAYSLDRLIEPRMRNAT